MSIKQKLVYGFGLLILIISVFSMYVFNSVNTFDKISDKKAASFEQLVDLEMIKNINTSMTLEAMDLIVDKDSGIVSIDYTNNINQLFKEIFAFEEELLSDAKGRKDKIDLIQEFMADYRNFEKVLKVDLPKLVLNHNSSSIKDFTKMDNFIDEYTDEVAEDINILTTIIHKDLEIATIEESSYSDEIRLFIIMMALISIFIAIVISILITKNILKSLDNFQNGLLGFFKYLNREETNVQLLDASTSDELGIMAKVVNENIVKTKEGIEEDRKVIEDTISVLSEFDQGDLCQRVHSSTNNPALQELTKLLNQMGGNIETNINSVLSILEEYSNSKYINKVKTSGIKEHLLSLANGVNTLGDAITTMLIENKSNGLTLGDSSAILLKNVNTLNQNSNESAAALEEVTSNISNTTNNIVDMATLAESVTKSANHGEKLAEQTNIAMNEIDKEVNSINEAISVIDQIAFQTNILSVNAAVEAATAGEAGKGFAVVAQEVRNLASRSAEAANEIKDLVQKATQKADSGKAIANAMIDGYHGLNQNISKTIELIGNVETASKEQLDGIKQINDAVTSLDQQTQENAVVASHTNDIASQTDSIANLIVSNANEKEFVGKDSVKAKSLDNTKNQATKQKNVVRKDIKSKTVDKKVLKSTKDITSISSKKDDDEWASF